MPHRIRLAGLLLATVTGFGARAEAAVFDFSYTLPSSSGDPLTYVTASGTLTTSNTLVSSAYTTALGYAITGVSGSYSTAFDGFPPTTQQITGVLSPDTVFGADNLLFPTAPYLDLSGFSFTLAGGTGGDDGAGDVNLEYDSSTGLYREPNESYGEGVLTITPADSVPEPGTLSLIGAGLLALGAARRRMGGAAISAGP